MAQFMKSKFLKVLILKTNPQLRAITIAYLLYSLLVKDNLKMEVGKKVIESFIYWLMVSKLLPNHSDTLLPKL